MFRGDEIHKLGPDTYKIVHGAFTTCVQPTPRWEMVAGSVTLKVDDHALLTNSVLRVKGVPVMYLPVFYYPVQEDDRATGFLMPIYGASTVRGQSLSNAFFWAINRSQDATFLHDWYSKTGQGFGERVPLRARGRQPRQRPVQPAERTRGGLPAERRQRDRRRPRRRIFLMRGGLSQTLGAGLHARANVNYTSSLAVQQRYQQNILQTNNRTRTIGGNVTGNWRGIRPERHDRQERHLLRRGQPLQHRWTAADLVQSRRAADRQVQDLLRREHRVRDANLQDGAGRKNHRRSRTDTSRRQPRRADPVYQVAVSHGELDVSWRDTYWTESLNSQGIQVPDSVDRRFFDLQARITGPVFNRIFDKPNSAYATKFKHVIEPTVVIQRVTAIDVFDQIVRIDGTDTIVGGTTRVTYGLNNRLYAKKETVAGNRQPRASRRATTRIRPLHSSIRTTRAATTRRWQPKNFSPVRIQSRVAPTDRIQPISPPSTTRPRTRSRPTPRAAATAPAASR